uniref:Uncharacterized protein n=1 Tax=Branchiostoma floridae TaxID=7739 RepID=C3YTN3_BRAFL|eukprot:XP_002600148.1 hypothetical protein BRAFLDRAFT_66656 [Branchiostoma floridae]
MRLPTAMWLVFAGLAFGGGYSSRSASSSDGEVPRNDSSAYGDGSDGTRSEGRAGPQGNFAGISEVLDALEKAVVFFLESYHDINLDGLYGLRVAEGQLTLLLDGVDHSVNTSSSTRHSRHSQALSRVHTILQDARTAGNWSLPRIRERDPGYFKEFKDVVSRPYVIRGYSRELGDHVLTRERPATKREMFSETRSDRCMQEMMGSTGPRQDPNIHTTRCTVTDECWRFVTADGATGYTITHQLLWTILGEHVGCKENINAFASREGVWEGVESIQQHLCTKILREAEVLATSGPPEPEQDLFLEQGVVCGMLGFRDFIRRDWLQKVLSWQRPEGCFGISHHRTARRLLVEKLLRDGCLSHKSGLGTAMLAMYVRYMLDPDMGFRTGDTERR